MTGSRFHINPDTGKPNICQAKKPENCRYFGDEHYDSREAARTGYERSQEASLLNPSLSKPREVELTEEGYLTDEFADQLRTEGVYCPKCNRSPTPTQVRDLIGNEFADCACGARYDLDTIKVDIQPGHPSYRFIQSKEEVLKATWYHATDKENWLEEVEDYGDGVPFEVHMGTESAAFDRGICNYALHDKHGEGFILYEVELDPDSQISDELVKDENKMSFGKDGADVVRYLNLWEDMASVSLAVKPEKVRIKSSRPVTREEAHRRISAYNVAPEPIANEYLENLEERRKRLFGD